MTLTIGTVSAQDIIVLNNRSADEIEAKVQEVSQKEVKYKKWSYQDGPTFTIPTSDIFVIKYRNGEKQRFGVEKSETPQPQTSVSYEPNIADQYAKPYNQRVSSVQGVTKNNSKTPQSQSNVLPTPASYTSQTENTIYQPSSQTIQSSSTSPKFDNENLARGFDGYVSTGYLLGLDDWWAVPLNLTLGYRFNSYLFVGGTSGAIYNEYGTIIPIMSTCRADVPLSRICSFFGEVSLGGGIVVDGDGTSGFMASVGPGISFSSFSLGVSYLYTGEGSGGIAFKLGFEF